MRSTAPQPKVRSLPLAVFMSLTCAVLLLALPHGGSVRAAPREPPTKAPDPAAPDPASKGGGETGTPSGSEEEPSDFWDGATTFSQAQVESAIEKAISWLRKAQGPDGSWPEIGGDSGSTYGGQSGGNTKAYTHPAGPTALALYALLKSKVPERDPCIQKAFKWLKRHHEVPRGSYEISMLILALTATADPYKSSKAGAKARDMGKLRLSGSYRSWVDKLKDELVDRRRARGWRYQLEGDTRTTPGGEEDLSSTQLAALALHAAHRAGSRVKDDVWEDILSFSLDQQETTGPEVEYTDPVDQKKTRKAKARGFAYILGQENPDEGGATGGMTACALANVEMARYVLSDGMSGKGRAEWLQRPDAEKVQQAIYDGLAWLDKNWSAFDNPGKKRSNIYTVYWLYALERAMDLFSLKLVGDHNWYNEIGQQLLNRQYAEGYWNSRTTLPPEEVLDTCFALLFLRRATSGQIPFGSVTGGGDSPVDNR